MANTKGQDIGIILDALANACRQLGTSDLKDRSRLRKEVRALDEKALQYLDIYVLEMKKSLKRKASLHLYDAMDRPSGSAY